jgi:hypothetical protein
VSPWDKNRIALQLERDDTYGPDSILVNYRYRISGGGGAGAETLQHEMINTSFTKKGTKTALQAMPRFLARDLILAQNAPYLKQVTISLVLLLRFSFDNTPV